MEFKYVYSTSRVKTISYKLLSENQLERLIGAKSLDEVFKVLQDTFLESFVTSKVTDISPVLENCLSQAKVLLSSVAPKPQMINLLWIEFDFFNLKIITKGKLQGWSNDEIKNKATFPGNFSLEALLKAYEEERLGSLSIYFDKAVKESQKSSQTHLDLIFDTNYLENLKLESLKLKSKLVDNFVSKIIDLFNFKTALRIKYLREQGVSIEDIYIDGGKVSKKDLESGKMLEVIKQLGNGKKWRKALEDYEKNGNFPEIEKASDEHLLNFLTYKSLDIFSLLALHIYLLCFQLH